MKDIMKSLMKIKPLPRGERLALWAEERRATMLRKKKHCLWVDLIWSSAFISDIFGSAELTRKFAEPLRRCKEEKRLCVARLRILEHKIEEINSVLNTKT